MKSILIFSTAAIILVPSAGFSQHQTLLLDEPVVGGTLPYQIELREITLGAAELREDPRKSCISRHTSGL